MSPEEKEIAEKTVAEMEKKAKEEEGFSELSAALTYMKEVNFKYSHVFGALLKDNISMANELTSLRARNKKGKTI